MKNLKKGMLISIEGIDGSGKSTLSKNLYNYLEKEQYPVILTKEPGATPLGLQLRSILQSKTVSVNTKAEFLLFAADRAQHFTDVIVENLKANKIIISDRLNDSSIAYQGYGRGLDIQTLKEINKWAMNDITPDLILYVKVDLPVAIERIKNRKEELTDFEKEKDFLQKVSQGFDKIFHNNKDVLILDGNKTQEEILEDAIKTIERFL